jgi:hypothetical protein
VDEGKTTRREKFLSRMEKIIPWQSAIAAIESFCPKGERGCPSSTKNQEKNRDPEICQTRKVNPSHFGMKSHIGANRDSKLVLSVVLILQGHSGSRRSAQTHRILHSSPLHP